LAAIHIASCLANKKMIDKDLNDRACVIIRAASERTEQLCQKLIIEQGVSSENLSVLKEAPFSAALKRSFETGIERGLKWTLCNDADVLLRPGAVETMLNLAEQQDEQVFEIQGFILDKFIGGPRNGGIHLYRTSLLPKALEKIPPEESIVRPEFHMLQAMAAIGYPYKTIPYLVGTHDFEQYYLDIFRKCFIHAHKHLYLAEAFLSFWRENAVNDMDYTVALHGFASGVEHFGEVSIDSRQEIYQTLLLPYQIQEKSELTSESYSLATIEEIINCWREPDIYRELYPTKFGLVSDETEKLSKKQKFFQLAADFGILKFIPYAIGSVLQKTGKWLQDWVNSSRKLKDAG
jgi:hypothetical protein